MSLNTLIPGFLSCGFQLIYIYHTYKLYVKINITVNLHLAFKLQSRNPLSDIQSKNVYAKTKINLKINVQQNNEKLWLVHYV